MRRSIIARFVGILAVAAALPLAIGLVSLGVLGLRYYRAGKGELFRATAEQLASSLNGVMNRQVETVQAWLAWSDVAGLLPPPAPGGLDEAARAETAAREARWPALAPDDPELAALLKNRTAGLLRRFQAAHPLFAEAMLTDAEGRLLAATDKTSDYWQADEDWWQKAKTGSPDRAWIEGIVYDESARVYSLSISIPVYGGDPPVFRGVFKGVLNASPLFASPRLALPHPRARADVLLGDGRVLAALDGRAIVPLAEREWLPSRAPGGWAVGSGAGGRAELSGVAALDLRTSLGGQQVAGVSPMYVVVHAPLAAVMGPVRRQLWLLTLAGGLGGAFFVLAGLQMSRRQIIAPLRLLREAARSISTSAHLKGLAAGRDPVRGAALGDRAARLLDRADAIRSGDEIEDLARDFGLMGRRILRYHEQMEREISEKTEELQRDLRLAREFQESLLPRAYPEIPADGDGARLVLDFHHVYKPALSLAGDFFDVAKLSDNVAGVFVADVMGHGARSALITAILRTLLQDLSGYADDPAQFLSHMNDHFSGIVAQVEDCIFATAFYLVVDVCSGVARYASAGHPSPLLVRRADRRVEPLVVAAANQPALGLVRDANYRGESRALQAADTILLYTDGAVEAVDPAGREFGEERLRAVLEAGLERPADELATAVLQALRRHMDTVPAADDICLVAVDLRERTTAQP